MEGVSQGVSQGAAIVPGIDSDIFTNASTITSWLQEQPEDVKVQLARGIFSELIRDVVHPRLSSTKACVKLCGFVQLCTKSTNDYLRQWAFAEDTSMRLFTLYIELNESHQHSPMKLVLDVLITTFTHNPDPEVGTAIKTGVLDSLAAVVSRQSSRSLVKSSINSLVHFLSKHAINLDDIGSAYRKIKPSPSELPDLELWRSFVGDVFSWMNLRHVCPIAGKFLVQLFQYLQELASGPSHPNLSGFGIGVWLEWVQHGLAANPDILETIKNYVFAPLFKTDGSSSLQLLEILCRQKPIDGMGGELDSGARLQLAGLEVGRKCGLVGEPGSSNSTAPGTGAIVIQAEVLEHFLIHPSHIVRSSALSLLISSPLTTSPMSQETFDLLQRHLATCHSDYDTKFRCEMLGYSGELVNRVQNVIAVAKRSLSKSGVKTKTPASVNGHVATTPKKAKTNPEDLLGDEKETREVLERHESFLSWYMAFLKGELIPTASYQRHITALRVLLMFLKTKKRTLAPEEPFDVNPIATLCTDPTWDRLILDLIMDPFDDVREAAATILQNLPQSIISTHVDFGANSSTLLASLREFCARVTSLAGRTGRADHGNGAARSQGLLCSWLSTQDMRVAHILDTLDRLEGKLSRAEQDLGHAATEDSVHVDFAALGYIWQVLVSGDKYSDSERQSLQQVQRRMFQSCEHVWKIVRPVLCIDTPEGHLPEELEEVEGLDTKDLLSYSFRAVHESSNLMRIIVSGLRNCNTATALYPPLDVFNGIGSLTFDQLSKLRHRGAFATVTSTFSTCCQLTQKLTDAFPDMPKSLDHLRAWYEGAIACIMNQASTTRRSAGIPALVIGILTANAESPSFKEVMLTLVRIAEKIARTSETDGSNLPQVHALNCLKDIFRGSLLSKRAETYLPTTLQLAASSLRSEVWAIRNCGLLLLRSLIDCLFGTGESKSSLESGWDGHTVRISYIKYPTLPGVLLGLLKPGEKSLELSAQSGAAAEAVFPALDIIRRAGPPEEHRDELYGYVEGYLGSHLWHVREMAARTLCSFLLRADWVGAVKELLSRSRSDANRLHGTLLTIKFVLERRMETGADAAKEDLPQMISTMGELLQECRLLQASPEVRAALLEILNLISRLNLVAILEETPAASILGNASEQGQATIASASSALLRMQLGIQIVHESARHADVGRLQLGLKRALEIDADTACNMLTTIPETWQARGAPGVCSQFCELYLDVPKHSDRPEPRTLALLNLRDLMDSILHDGELDQLPSEERLQQLWAEIQMGDINPTLSQAILAVSGTLVATRVVRGSVGPQTVEHQVRAWGAMVADALDIDNTFDTRFAATEAIRSFTSATGPRTGSQYLPCILALYDALNDDDEEVRDVAAAAAASIVGRRVASLEAADLLLDWLGRHFSHDEAFRSAVAGRLVGQQTDPCSTTDPAWASAEDLLDEALEFDDSLFAVEEQNLFIDEVRESKRWLRVFGGFASRPEGESHRRLRDWTTAGLRALIGLARRDDRPLGWASQQQVFALCSRVLLCAGTLNTMGNSAELGDLLREFSVAGRASGVHGSLLQYAGGQPE